MLVGPANTPSVVTCAQDGPKAVARSGLLHAAWRSGGRQRRRPTGAAAYGMPRNVFVPFLTKPRTGPSEVRTSGLAALAPAGAGRASSERPQTAANAAERRKTYNFDMTSHRQSGH